MIRRPERSVAVAVLVAADAGAVRSSLARVGVYIAVVGTSVALVMVLIRVGAARYGAADVSTAVAGSGAPELTRELSSVIQNPLATLMLQLLVIVSAAQLFSMAARALRQPPVVGELVAGIVLGPSVFGQFAPGAWVSLFPASSLGPLGLLGQLGVVLYMFIVGLDLNTAEVRRGARAAVAISHSSIVVPFTLGVLIAFPLFGRYAPAGVPFEAFALFVGVALSITAFPVLARILDDRRLTGTPLGTTALACAAVDDVTAWTLLAVVVALVTAGTATTLFSIVGSIAAFTLLMIYAVRPTMHWWLQAHPPSAALPRVAIPLGLAFASALVTEAIGIHAMFGAFLAGAVMPADAAWRAGLKEKVDSLCRAVLLPVFFAFTGLRTRIGLLHGAEGWLVCLAVVAVATTGKLFGGMLAARWTGFRWHDAFAIGALLNTRGLIEIVALNVGYELGILSPTMFTILVVMALATTAMTCPLLDVAQALKVRGARAVAVPLVS